MGERDVTTAVQFRCYICGQFLRETEPLVWVEEDAPMRMVQLDPPSLHPAHLHCATPEQEPSR